VLLRHHFEATGFDHQDRKVVAKSRRSRAEAGVVMICVVPGYLVIPVHLHSGFYVGRRSAESKKTWMGREEDAAIVLTCLFHESDVLTLGSHLVGNSDSFARYMHFLSALLWLTRHC